MLKPCLGWDWAGGENPWIEDPWMSCGAALGVTIFLWMLSGVLVRPEEAWMPCCESLGSRKCCAGLDQILSKI